MFLHLFSRALLLFSNQTLYIFPSRLTYAHDTATAIANCEASQSDTSFPTIFLQSQALRTASSCPEIQKRNHSSNLQTLSSDPSTQVVPEISVLRILICPTSIVCLLSHSTSYRPPSQEPPLPPPPPAARAYCCGSCVPPAHSFVRGPIGLLACCTAPCCCSLRLALALGSLPRILSQLITHPLDENITLPPPYYRTS